MIDFILLITVLSLTFFASILALLCFVVYCLRKMIKSLYLKYMYGPILCLSKLRFGLQYSTTIRGNEYFYENDQIIVKSSTYINQELRNVILSAICNNELQCGYTFDTKIERCNRIITIYHCQLPIAKIITHKRYNIDSTGNIRMKQIDDVNACYV